MNHDTSAGDDDERAAALLAHLIADDDTEYAVDDSRVRDELIEEALDLSRLALAIGRGELTLGTYLRGLRTSVGLSAREAGAPGKLADTVVNRIEQDRGLRGVQPDRLAVLAAHLGGIKRILMTLVQAALSQSEPLTTNPGLTRVNQGVSEAARNRILKESTPDGGSSASEAEYLLHFSSAFESELARIRRP